MWFQLTLTNFKSFRHADVPIGPFTVIVGTNASGKSNIRDAFRFIHGIGRKYALAEIVGAKYGDGGELVWRGIRGGTKELIYGNGESLSISATTTPSIGGPGNEEVTFSLKCQIASNNGDTPVNVEESLVEKNDYIYNSHPDGIAAGQNRLAILTKIRRKNVPKTRPVKDFLRSGTILSHIAATSLLTDDDSSIVGETEDLFASVRFLDLSPERMRQPSFPGQNVLGDQGENLSSVLMAICEDANRKAALLEWISELTPMDAKDFEFLPDPQGKVILTLIEIDGRKTTAYSASDGTLRFLAMAAALLGPRPAKLYFFEELDNGIHPTRLHLLLQLIEKTVKAGKIQVIATTHSPELLSLLSDDSLGSALLVYRLPHQPDSRVKRIVDLPNARELIARQSAGRLHATGWLEDAVAFTEGGDE